MALAVVSIFERMNGRTCEYMAWVVVALLLYTASELSLSRGKCTYIHVRMYCTLGPYN